MDGIYPKSDCWKFPFTCNNGITKSYTGGTWVSSSFIRNRGETSFVTMPYDEGYTQGLKDGQITNNPSVQIFCRVAPSQYNPNKLVFWLNGWERPRLFLKIGQKYQVNVVTAGNPFYFTLDSEGGKGNNKNITQVYPSDYFTTTFTMNDYLPKKFYYQSANTEGMGGEVILY